MKTKRMWITLGCAMALAALVFFGSHKIARAQARPAAGMIDVPTFQVDAAWPKKPFPNDWALGAVSGVTVDSMDHIWAITRPREAPVKGKTMINPVIEFDQAGNVMQAWGGLGEGENYEWPKTEHG